jgi:hypothetical protein
LVISSVCQEFEGEDRTVIRVLDALDLQAGVIEQVP